MYFTIIVHDHEDRKFEMNTKSVFTIYKPALGKVYFEDVNNKMIKIGYNPKTKQIITIVN